MESILLAIGPELISLVGVALVALASWGIALLKQKVKIEAAKSALDQIDQIVGVVVGNLSQTSVKDLKIVSKDGHLTKVEKDRLKIRAFNTAKLLISQEIKKAASKGITSLEVYLTKKIEERVLTIKGGDAK